LQFIERLFVVCFPGKQSFLIDVKKCQGQTNDVVLIRSQLKLKGAKLKYFYLNFHFKAKQQDERILC